MFLSRCSNINVLIVGVDFMSVYEPSSSHYTSTISFVKVIFLGRKPQIKMISSVCLFHTQSFIVRNSQKARYALSVRLENDDPAVKHFLIQTNQERELKTSSVGQGVT